MQVSLAGPKEDLRNERFIELGKGNDRRGSFRGIAQQLFCPRHIVPAAELVAAARKNADAAEAQMFVEANAVVRQVFVAFALGLADAGIEVIDVLRE